jgi:hypothetical protein
MGTFCRTILLLVLGATPLMAQAGTPSISFESLEQDLGKVMQGDPVKCVFKFHNQGTGTLKIVDVAPGCGCTTTLLSAKQVKPGGYGEIGVTVNTSGIIGPIRKAVTVTSNDPKQPEVNLVIAAVVEPEIALSEPAIFFGSVPMRKEVAKEIMLTIPADRPIKILGAETSDDSIGVSFSAVPGTDGKRIKVVVTHKANAKPGYYFGTVIIKTTSRRTPEITLGIRGTVDPALNN